MKSIAVIGLGQFGYQLAINLTQKGYQVFAIEKEDEIIAEIKDLVSSALILDSTDEKAMRSVNIDQVDQAVVAIGSNVQSSLLTTALLLRTNIAEIHVRAINPLQESILKTMNVKNIINIEKEMGQQLANALTTEVGRYIEISDRHSLMEIQMPKSLVGKTLKSLRLRRQFGVNIVGIKTQHPAVKDNGDIVYQYQMTDVPDPNYPLHKEDILVIAGTDDNLGHFVQWGAALD